jgi:hypothetical protein
MAKVRVSALETTTSVRLLVISCETSPTLVDPQLDGLQFNVKYFDNNDEINTLVRSPEYKTPKGTQGLCLAIVMTKNSKAQYEYLIRYNTTSEIGDINIPDTRFDRTDPVIKYIPSKAE